MRQSFDLDKWLAPILLPAAAALLAFSFSAPAQAATLVQNEKGFYVVPADGSYGVDECIAHSFECGSVVASAWCEAHGHGGVRAFGPASDATFSTLVDTRENEKKVSPTSIVIACEE